jgi:hypothetical protein
MNHEYAGQRKYEISTTKYTNHTKYIPGISKKILLFFVFFVWFVVLFVPAGVIEVSKIRKSRNLLP